MFKTMVSLSQMGSRAIHDMLIEEKYLRLIESGAKSIEGRVKRPQYAVIKANDVIRFIDTKNKNHTSHFLVEKVTFYKCFEEMLKKEGLPNCLPGITTLSEGLNVYHSFPSYKQDAEKLGVIAFKVLKAPTQLWNS